MRSFFLSLLVFMVFLAGCSPKSISTSQTATPTTTPQHAKIGLLLQDDIEDQTWGSQGYRGLRKIKEKYQAEIDYKQNLKTEKQRIYAANNMGSQGFNMVIGNGIVFQSSFNQVAKKYPHTKFVFFNGSNPEGNVTSVLFNPSLGYFMGLAAGLCTKNHRVGVVAAFYHTKTLKYLAQGVKDANHKNQVFVDAVHSWDDKKKAGAITDQMLKRGVDMLVPIGNGYSIEVTMRARKSHVHVISYISNLSYMASDTVITSGQQNLVATYLKIADEYYKGNLHAGKMFIDFKDGSQSIAPFNHVISKDVQNKVFEKIKNYNEGTFKLPDISKSPL
jgi:transcriptional activator of comK gene